MTATPKTAASGGKPFLGFHVFVDSHVGRKGLPANASFERWVHEVLDATRSMRRQVNIALFDEADARGLNRRDRGKDYATNILSYRYEPLPGEKSGLLGDLAICPAVVMREASAQGKPLRDHYAHLTVHGVLHLLGHDHETRAEAERMEALERRILARLGIPDPYASEVRPSRRRLKPAAGNQ
jgi:probable rRNA maturation factor